MVLQLLGRVLYQLVQRRDSISYSEFLQDRLPADKIEMHIKNLMSKEEKRRCLEYYKRKDPESLWNDLWINHKSHVYRNNMKKCCDAFFGNMEKYLHPMQSTDPSTIPLDHMQIQDLYLER